MLKIKVNTKVLLASLNKLKVDSARKMEGMVRQFAYNITLSGTENTPLGDAIQYKSWYDMRQFLPKEEGLARANWQYSESRAFQLYLDTGKNTDQAALNRVTSASTGYKLGDKFYIGNDLSYIMMLENNHSIQTGGAGIIKPTLATIQSVYSARLDDYYKQTP